MTQPLTFRRGMSDDAEALARLAARTFLETYRDFEEVQDNADYVAKHFQMTAIAASTTASESTMSRTVCRSRALGRPVGRNSPGSPGGTAVLDM